MTEAPCLHPDVWEIRLVETEPTVVVEVSCFLCGEKMSLSSEHATLVLRTGQIVVDR